MQNLRRGALNAMSHSISGRMFTVAALLFGSACIAVPASAALYKWTDANGRIVYSDQPPAGNVKTETVQGAAPPSNPNAVKEMATKEAEFKKRQSEAAEKEKKADTQRAETSKRNEQCGRAMQQVKQLANEQVGMARINEKGETVYMDDASRRKERNDLEIWVKANCTT